MRTVEEIRAELPRVAFAADRYVATRKSEQQYEIELRAAITTNIPIDRLKAICAAERDGQLYTVHDVAVILALSGLESGRSRTMESKEERLLKAIFSEKDDADDNYPET